MRIDYPKASEFLDACEEAIRSRRDALLAGTPVEIKFKKAGGYNGKIRVKIEANNAKDFWTDRKFSDPTRFPVRIKAAAWALFREKCLGEFVIEHESGELTISYIHS
jgi:hypothetical protein